MYRDYGLRVWGWVQGLGVEGSGFVACSLLGRGSITLYSLTVIGDC